MRSETTPYRFPPPNALCLSRPFYAGGPVQTPRVRKHEAAPHLPFRWPLGGPSGPLRGLAGPGGRTPGEKHPAGSRSVPPLVKNVAMKKACGIRKCCKLRLNDRCVPRWIWKSQRAGVRYQLPVRLPQCFHHRSPTRRLARLPGRFDPHPTPGGALSRRVARRAGRCCRRSSRRVFRPGRAWTGTGSPSAARRR